MNRKKLCNRKNQRDRFAYIVKRIRLPLLGVAAFALTIFVIMPLWFRAGAIPAPERTIAPSVPVQTPLPTPEPVYAIPVANDAEPICEETEAPACTEYKLGDKAEEIVRLQQRLMDLNYMDSDEPTDEYGATTRSAVELFQHAHYITETGIADAITQNVLFSDDAHPYVLSEGNKGDDVEALQVRLGELGYYSDKTNGYFGVATASALKAFQTRNALETDGKADVETRDTLFSSKAKPLIDPTPTPKPPTPKPSPKVTPKKTPKPTAKPTSAASTAPEEPATPAGEGTVEGMIAFARLQLNKPYVRGKSGPSSFDCSGLVYYCLKNCGVSTRRYNAAGFSQVEAWEKVSSQSDLKRGDLVFFRNAESARISHTGIYLGGNQYLHASSSAGKVVISSLGSWAKNYFMLGRRVFGG